MTDALTTVVTVLAYGAVGWLLLVGVYGIATSRNYIHAIVCLSLVQSSTYLLLLAVGFTRSGTAPVFGDVKPGATLVDPVVQALTLTDVVVGATVTALLLALTIQLVKRHRTIDPDEVRSLEESSEE